MLYYLGRIVRTPLAIIWQDAIENNWSVIDACTVYTGVEYLCSSDALVHSRYTRSVHPMGGE